MFWHDKFIELSVKLKQLKTWKILRQEYGSILIFTAAVLPILLGLTGIAFDVGNLYMHKARLQNIADAAALAGARAFADSQANADENDRDKVDQKITVTSYKPAVTYSFNDKPSEREKQHGTVASPHQNADKEADKYIYNNLANLGNDISTDLYSHYALLSKEYNPRTFYRVGLVEKVDLYFLPIIRGIGKKQSVGVEAIVLLSEDTGEEIPDTVFSNLFTYTGKLNAQANKNNTVKTTFEGQISYTGDMNASENEYFEVNGNLPYLYTDTGGNQTNNPKKHSTGINLEQYIDFFREKVDQTKALNACVELDMSVESERKKLTQDTVRNMNDLTKPLYQKQEIDKNGNLMYIIKYTDEFNAKKDFTFSINEAYDDNDYRRYYTIDDQDNTMYCLKYVLDNGLAIRVASYVNEQQAAEDGFRPYPEDPLRPYTDPDTNREYKYYVVDGSKDRLYYSIGTAKGKNDRYWVYFVTPEKKVLYDAYWTPGGTNGNPTYPDFYLYPWAKNSDQCGTHFKYSTQNKKDVDYRLISFKVFKDVNFTSPTARNLTLNANVFHLIKKADPTYSAATELTFQNKLTGHGNTSEPIYIIDETENELKITVNESNERPVVIVHTGSTPVTVIINRSKTFNGTIYAPNATVKITPRNGTTFEGNIVASDISVIKESLDSTSTFIQKNHLESDTDLYGKIIQYAQNDTNGEAQLFSDATDLSKPPSNTFNSSWENWYSYVGKDAAEAWFNSLNHNQQVAFWRTWDAAHRPPNADEYGTLFPDQGPYNAWYDQDGWKDPKNGWYFTDWSPTTDEKNDAKLNKVIEHVFDTKVRLINPRLDANPFNS